MSRFSILSNGIPLFTIVVKSISATTKCYFVISFFFFALKNPLKKEQACFNILKIPIWLFNS